jgi:hypothetical protein
MAFSQHQMTAAAFWTFLTHHGYTDFLLRLGWFNTFVNLCGGA